MVRLQTYLEYVCYAFVQRNAPEILLRHSWDCAEAASLRTWSEEIDCLRKAKSDDDISDAAAAKDLNLLMAAIQDTTVNRTPIDIARVQEYLQGAEAFVRLLGIEDCLSVISQLRSSVELAINGYSQSEGFAQRILRKRLLEIADARADLDKQEKIARDKMQKAKRVVRDRVEAEIVKAIEKVQAALLRIDSDLGNWENKMDLEVL